MTLRETLDELIQAFNGAGMSDPGFEARQLVQEALEITFAQLVSRPERTLDEAAVAKINAWRGARLEGQPLAYLSGRRGFYKYEFQVGPGVLVPRPETELVVETALRRLDERRTPVERIADLGCGSGCIGLSLLAELSAATLFAVDQSPDACRYTKLNAEHLGLIERVEITQARVETWAPFDQFDVIVANPPYIAPDDPRVEPGVRKFEPAAALFADDGGLSALREWSGWAMKYLAADGLFVCEFGAGQSENVQDILAKRGFAQIQIERDLAGFDRVASAVRAR